MKVNMGDLNLMIFRIPYQKTQVLKAVKKVNTKADKVNVPTTGL